jgi:glutathione S-transferase
MNSVELPLLSILLVDWAKDGCGKHRENTVGWANRLLTLTGLERWLDGRQHVATDSFTAFRRGHPDGVMVHVLEEIRDESMIEPYSRVVAYRSRGFARPAWKRTIDSYNGRVR